MYWLPSVDKDKSQASVTLKSTEKLRSHKSLRTNGNGNGWKLTDGALVSPGVVDFIVPDSLRTVHSLIEHHELHLLLLHHFLLHAAIHAILVILRLVHLAIVKVVGAETHSLVLVLDHASARVVLVVALLLVGLDGDVGVDAVEVFLLLRKHGLSPLLLS